MLIYFLLSALLLLLHFVYASQMKNRNMPPGPLVLPILGSTLSIWLHKPTFRLSQIRPWIYLDILSKRFGDLYAVSLFGFDAVILASYEILKEVENMEEYSCKFAHELYTFPCTFEKELGILFAYSNPLWTEMRKFTVKTLREFGFGKLYTMQSIITMESTNFVSHLKETIGNSQGVVYFHNTFSMSMLNVLWCMVAGIRYEHGNPKIQRLLFCIFQFSKSSTIANPIEFFMHHIKKLAPNLLNVPLREKAFKDMHDLAKSLIEESRKQGNFLTNPQNYIDAFLKRIEETKNDKDTLYTEQQLQVMISDLLLVGTLTLNATLSYAVLFLLLNPEVQTKCQLEIDSIVGRQMVPSLEDIKNMPFLQAFLLEVHRCANVVPNPIPRLVPKNWNLRGYVIPKGTTIISNHYSINMNANIWGDAHVFRPERFISEKGDFVPDPRVVVFGFGKRICIGSHLVNAIFPLFVAHLLQVFHFSVTPGSKLPSVEPEIGVSLSPAKFAAQVTIRRNSP